MDEPGRDDEGKRRRTLTSVACWLVLAAVLLGVLRLTSLGAQTTPTLEVRDAVDAAVPLWRPPASPAHRLVAVRLGLANELFLLDTGAAETVIDPAAAERAGLGDSARPVLTALNDSFGFRPLVRVDELAIGPWVYKDFEAVVVDLSHLDSVLGGDISGVVGMNVLGRRPFEIDFVRDTLRIGGSLEAFEAIRPPGAVDSGFALLELDGTFVAELGVEGQTSLFVIDTGAVPTTVQPDRGFRRPVQQRQFTRFDADGARSMLVRSVELESLSLGHVVRADFTVDLGDFNLLGGDFLRGLTLFIAPDARWAILRSPEGA